MQVAEFGGYSVCKRGYEECYRKLKGEESTDRWGEKGEMKGFYIGFLDIFSIDGNMCGYSEKYVQL